MPEEDKVITTLDRERKLCDLIPTGHILPTGEYIFNPRECRILSAALYSAKSTLAEGSPRRVFIEDLAAALDRRGLIDKKKIDEFVKAGFEYMEAK